VSERPLQIGIVGCGNVLSAYGPAIQQLAAQGLANVVVACGRESQRDFARSQLGSVRFIVNSDEVMGSSEVDLVMILTSMRQHGPLARTALEAGKHVFVEKPLATALDEARLLIELARHSAGRLICAPFTILSPTFQKIAAHIRAGDIGQPCSARARYGWAGPWWSEWFYQNGGGALFDLGVYCITSLTGLLGPVRRVTALTGVAIPEREINGRKIQVEADDNAQVLLDFGGACFGVVTSGFTIQQYRCPALEIYGTTGTLQMLGDDWDPDGYELWQNAAGCWQVFKETAPDWPWHDGLRHFVECIHAGTPPLVTPEHALHVLEIMLKAPQASRDGRMLEIESTFELSQFPKTTEHEPAHLRHDRSRAT
jgi:predicted dehydrogenase